MMGAKYWWHEFLSATASFHQFHSHNMLVELLSTCTSRRYNTTKALAICLQNPRLIKIDTRSFFLGGLATLCAPETCDFANAPENSTQLSPNARQPIASDSASDWDRGKLNKTNMGAGHPEEGSEGPPHSAFEE